MQRSFLVSLGIQVDLQESHFDSRIVGSRCPQQIFTNVVVFVLKRRYLKRKEVEIKDGDFSTGFAEPAKKYQI